MYIYICVLMTYFIIYTCVDTTDQIKNEKKNYNKHCPFIIADTYSFRLKIFTWNTKKHSFVNKACA